MKALFELFRRFNARRIFGFIRRLGGMSRPKVKCYDLRSTRALRVEGDIKGFRKKVIVYQISIHALRVEGDKSTTTESPSSTSLVRCPCRLGTEIDCVYSESVLIHISNYLHPFCFRVPFAR